jgi:hypothetical protein
MNIQNRYTAAINRLTVIAANIDYCRLYKGMPECKFNRLRTKVYKQINDLQDLCKYLPALIAAYGENEVNTRELKHIVL